MSLSPSIAVRVVAIKSVTSRIKQFELQALDERPLPAFDAGSHIIVSTADANSPLHNAYSLINWSLHPTTYTIAVQLSDRSRGGSRYLHETVKVNDQLLITAPKNLFTLVNSSAPIVLLAAGIGITPILAFAQQLQAQQRAFDLHYCFRGDGNAAFVEQLQTMCNSSLHCYDSTSASKIDLPTTMKQLPRNAQVYVCGPESFIAATQSAMLSAGFSLSQFHCEHFSTVSKEQNSFVVVLNKSGQQVRVDEGQSILQALQAAGRRDLCSLCCEGVCGSCELPLLEGEADHRDQYFTDAEKLAQKSILICVSRAKTATLVLDA